MIWICCRDRCRWIPCEAQTDSSRSRSPPVVRPPERARHLWARPVPAAVAQGGDEHWHRPRAAVFRWVGNIDLREQRVRTQIDGVARAYDCTVNFVFGSSVNVSSALSPGAIWLPKTSGTGTNTRMVLIFDIRKSCAPLPPLPALIRSPSLISRCVITPSNGAITRSKDCICSRRFTFASAACRRPAARSGSGCWCPLPVEQQRWCG